MTSRTASVAKGAAIISLGTLFSRILGLVRDRMLLGTFGDSDIAGAYNSAFNVPDLLYYLLAGGALSAAFIPVFSAYITRGEQEDANRTGSSVGNLMLLALLIGVVIELMFTPAFVRLIAPGYEPGTPVFALTVSLTRVLCVMVIFTALSGLLTGMLNSYHHFLAPTLVWNTYNLGIIFGIGVLSKSPWVKDIAVRWFGDPLASTNHASIFGVAFGVLIGAVSMVVIQIPVLLRHGFRYSPIIQMSHAGVKQVLKLFAPVMIGLSMSQLNLQAIPLVIGSLLGAPAVTDLKAANRLVMLPLGLFAVAISTAAFPKLAQQVARGETSEFLATVNQAIRAILLLCIPSAMGMFLLAEPMTFLLWGGDEFGVQGIRAAGFALVFFAWGVLGISLMQILNRAFYSLHDTITPVILGVSMVLVNIPLAWTLAKFTPLKYGGVALSTTLTTTVACLVLMALLRKRLGGLQGRALLIMATKVLAASAVMGIVIYFVALALAPTLADGTRIVPVFHWPAPFLPQTRLVGQAPPLDVPHAGLVMQMGACILLGGASYLLALRLLGVHEIAAVGNRIRAKFRRK
jgi:putative peptidoglycan lipid II flippase